MKLAFKGVMPVYLGEDPAFRHLAAIGGLDILITGGPAIDSYFLRSAMQVDELLRWFAEQHAAGVTVRGGRLRAPKQPGQPGAGMQSGKGQSDFDRARRPSGHGGGTVKRVQILQQDHMRSGNEPV